MTQIDYSKLNERIVDQAYATVRGMSEAEKHKLISEKLERAIHYHNSLRNTVYHQIED